MSKIIMVVFLYSHIGTAGSGQLGVTMLTQIGPFATKDNCELAGTQISLFQKGASYLCIDLGSAPGFK